MAVQTKGLCKYCGKEYTKAVCCAICRRAKEKRKAYWKKKEKNMSIFSGCYYWKISKDYWLIVEAE